LRNPLYNLLPDDSLTGDDAWNRSVYINNYLKNTLGNSNINKTRLGHNASGTVVDVKTEYITNNFGFRDSFWEGPSDILAVGCSNTYGIGVPKNGTWPSILGKFLDKDIRNLSLPGISIQELVFQVFEYCKRFENPKTIICLFPDPFRMVVPTIKDFLVVSNDNPKNGIETVQLNNKNEVKEYMKKPYNYNDFLIKEFALFFSIKAIHMLEQYCNSNNIELIWSSWDHSINHVFSKIQDLPFNNFYADNFFGYDNPGDQCHKEYKDAFLNYFNRGQDIENGKEYSHAGVHWHVHVAEKFYNKINRLETK